LSFCFETHTLFSDGAWFRALANLLVSVFVGLAGVRVGLYIASRLGGTT